MHADEGRKVLSQIMLDVANCGDDAGCRSIKGEFVSAVQYHQLKDESHYEALAEKISENTQTLYGLKGIHALILFIVIINATAYKIML